MEPTPNDVFLAALDALLTTVDKSAHDLRGFHETVTGMITESRLAPVAPFPRASVMLTERVIQHLTAVEKDLEDILLALGHGLG